MPIATTPTRDGGAARERHRILIADDNADSLESLALLLERAGHQVSRATNGAEACDLAAASRPDVALLDIGMPVLDGYETARRIRAHVWGRAIRLIALSGRGERSDVQRSVESGFDAHLVKPVSFHVLADTIERSARDASSERPADCGDIATTSARSERA